MKKLTVMLLCSDGTREWACGNSANKGNTATRIRGMSKRREAEDLDARLMKLTQKREQYS